MITIIVKAVYFSFPFGSRFFPINTFIKNSLLKSHSDDVMRVHYVY